MSAHERSMVAVFPEKMQEGLSLKQWPVHLTVMPWTDVPPEELAKTVEDMRERRCLVYLARQALFGENGNVPVLLAEPGVYLREMHQGLLDQIGTERILGEDEHIGEEYVPHVTPKSHHETIGVGTNFHAHHLTVVSSPEQGSYTIHKNVKLGK